MPLAIVNSARETGAIFCRCRIATGPHLTTSGVYAARCAEAASSIRASWSTTEAAMGVSAWGIGMTTFKSATVRAAAKSAAAPVEATAASAAVRAAASATGMAAAMLGER